jgi:alkyl hydroperoxide reductase subunit F
VVQALNQMALLHSRFKHTMIDGAYTQDEIASLGIQGVPSVVVNGKLVHSGKISFADLLSKLENHFGTVSIESVASDLGQFDVVIVGGGPAGASAAIYSARKGLKTAMIAERIGGQIQDTKGIENLISVLYTEGPQLAAQLQQHIQNYQIKLLEHRRVKTISKDPVKKIELEGGETLTAKSVIIATGAKWRELGVPGEKEYIGRGVAFCPHCDGPYYKGKKVAVIGGGNSGVEAAIDLAGIVREVVLIEFGSALKADQVLVEKLKSLSNSSIVLNARTSQIVGDGQKVVALEFEDRTTQKTQKIDLDGVFVQIGLLPNSQFIKDTVELSKTGEIVVDPKGRTSVSGIYAAGDVTTSPYKQIIIAMGEGAKVALASFEDSMYAPQNPSITTV